MPVRFRWVAVALLAAAAVVALMTRDGRARPNVLLIITDDQHPRALDSMPNVLAQIAARGARFDNAFASTPICAPSRASILTGLYPASHGVHSNGIQQEDGTWGDAAAAFEDSSTLATWLDQSGYATALVGKYLNHYHDLSPYVPPGWDEWYVFVEDAGLFFDYTLNENGTHVRYGSDDADYATDVLAGHALDFVERHSDEPFFLVLSFSAPHSPSTAAPRHRGELAKLPPWRPPSWSEPVAESKPGWLRQLTRSVEDAGLAERTRHRVSQLEALLSVDEAIGKLLRLLDERGVGDETIVVFTADHGLHWGEHRWTGKQLPYEESIRVPLLVRYPGRWPAASRHAELALNVDIAPTILQLTGVRPDRASEGRSLVGLAGETGGGWREAVLLEHFAGGFLVPPWRAVRSGRHKLVRSGVGFWELYDLEADPYELRNLAKDPAYVKTRRRLARHLRQ